MAIISIVLGQAKGYQSELSEGNWDWAVGSNSSTYSDDREREVAERSLASKVA